MTHKVTSQGFFERCAWAECLFAPHPTRRALFGLKPAWACREVTVRVHRNHSFEHVISAAGAWAAYAGIRMSWADAPYDDALSMQGLGEQPDLEVIWYDVEAVQSALGEEVTGWLLSRAQALRKLSNVPILMVVLGLEETAEQLLHKQIGVVPGLRLAPTAQVLAGIANPFDDRLRGMSGSRLSETANLMLAKQIACRWLPAMLAPRLKAVIVDLDQTLYEGVLGEDGFQVRLSAGHAALQSALKSLKASGLFLGVVSKNTREDVEALFAARADFPLKLADFSAVEIGWGSKSDAIRRACVQLRIDPSAIVFIDDNPGEMLEVAAHLPEVGLIHAAQDVEQTCRNLDFFPGIWTWGVSHADMIRVADLNAVIQRRNIGLQAADKTAYLRELAPELEIWIRPVALRDRLHELSNKTNQFNLSLSRLDEVTVDAYLQHPDKFAVAVGLSDRLTDSGVVAAMFGSIKDGEITVEEWVISCRALGRELEGLIAASALRALAPDTKKATFRYKSGPRNSPGLDWLAKSSGCALEHEGSVSITISTLPAIADLPINLTIHPNERS
jgi:FkbH-like protein